MKFKKNPFHERVLLEEFKRKNQRKYTKREYRDRYFFPDEWMCFFDKLRPKQKITFHCLINTGARITELTKVQIKDIDFERQNVVFRWTKSRNRDGTRRIRTIPVSKQFTKYLKNLVKNKKLKPEDHLPILSIPAANIGMKKALLAAKIPDWQMFSVHNVRKTTEMFLNALGIDSFKVAMHMGHSVIIAMKHYVSTEIFNFEDKQMMREIIGDLYELDRWRSNRI